MDEVCSLFICTTCNTSMCLCCGTLKVKRNHFSEMTCLFWAKKELVLAMRVVKRKVQVIINKKCSISPPFKITSSQVERGGNIEAVEGVQQGGGYENNLGDVSALVGVQAETPIVGKSRGQEAMPQETNLPEEGSVSTMGEGSEEKEKGTEVSNKGGASKKVQGREEYVFDEGKLMEKYNETPHHVAAIKGFPRRKTMMFFHLKDRIPIVKNGKFLHFLFNTKDCEGTVDALQVTMESYEEKFGSKFEDITLKPTVGATGGRGKDTVTGGNTHRRSQAWLKGLTWAFNLITDFIQSNPEFGLFDWSVATLDEVDIFLGYLWVWMGPQEGGSSLGGTRYQSDSLKQMKTKLHNLIAEVLKRPDVDLNSPAMVFSNNMYIAKRNRTAAEPMEGNAGDRKRKALEVADREKMDAWMLEDLSKVLFLLVFS